MANSVKYVCNINVMSRYAKQLIMAGTPFEGAMIMPHTLSKLQMQGHITEYAPEAPIQVISVPKGKQLVSIPSHTPGAALNPPTLTVEQKFKNEKAQELRRKEAKAAKVTKEAEKAKDKQDKADAAVQEEKDAQAELAKIEAAKPKTKPKKESTVERIFKYDPAKLKALDLPVLLDSYLKICVDNDLEPIQFDPDNQKALIIEKLSSQFVPDVDIKK